MYSAPVIVPIELGHDDVLASPLHVTNVNPSVIGSNTSCGIEVDTSVVADSRWLSKATKSRLASVLKLFYTIKRN